MATAGRVLMIPAGEWKSGSNYKMLDVTIYAGSSYVAKNDINNSTKAPPTDTANWQLLAQGYDVTNIVTKSMIANNFLATDPNTVLSGPRGKELKEDFERLNRDLPQKSGVNTVLLANNESERIIIRYTMDNIVYQLSAIDNGFRLQKNSNNKWETVWNCALTDDLTTLKTRQRWLTLATGVSELFDDADYHPYAIVTGEYVHISGGFKTSTDISASTPIMANMVPPAKERWVPLYNISKNAIYFGYITTGGSNLTTSNLPAGNYVIDFGYQKSYGNDF